MRIFDYLGMDIGYVLIGVAGVVLLLFILLIIIMVKHHNLKKKYVRFMDGNDGKNLEEAIMEKFSSIEKLEEDTQELYKRVSASRKQLSNTYQKVGLIKYDAFSEVGGQMSFVLVMLTESDDGFILNCMHSSREGCFTYIKDVVKGKTDIVLSDEEAKALEEAKMNTLVKNVVEQDEEAELDI